MTFTDPEIASVGLSEAAARARGIDVVVARADPAETARGYIHDFHGGALKLVADRERGVLIGATLVTPRAGEIVGELVLAIKLRTPLETLADVIHPFPAFNRVLGATLEELAAKTACNTWRDPDPLTTNTEVTMSTQTIHEDATHIRTAATTDLKLEVVVIPVSDVDRAKRFYESLGWRLDADFASGDDWRVVQMTPPGSPCSVMFGKGFTTAAPGSVQGTFLVVDDIEAARAELIGHGVDVSEVFHFDGSLLRVAGTKGRVPGPDPEGRSYFSFASFSDPDGNGWLLQEVKTRLPGRGLSLGRRDADRAAARNREAPWRVRADRSEAPLVGVVRRLHRRARAGEDSRGGGQRWRAPHRDCSPMRADIESGILRRNPSVGSCRSPQAAPRRGGDHAVDDVVGHPRRSTAYSTDVLH